MSCIKQPNQRGGTQRIRNWPKLGGLKKKKKTKSGVILFILPYSLCLQWDHESTLYTLQYNVTWKLVVLVLIMQVNYLSTSRMHDNWVNVTIHTFAKSNSRDGRGSLLLVLGDD